MNSEKKDTFQQVTDSIVNAIEAGAGNYRMPWRVSGGFPSSPINAASKHPYRGVNILVLWAAGLETGFKSGTWATYRQWQELGAQVKKGEKSTNVVFWKFLDREKVETDGAGESRNRRIPMARDYSVFNAEQVDGYSPPEQASQSRTERVEAAESFFRDLGVEVKPGENRAFYSQDDDRVYLPGFEAFKESLFYYSVLSHETIHWSGAKHRLNRDLTGRFGSESYAMEELVAELGAALLCSQLGLPTDPRDDHAPYIASWLKVLRNDKRAIFTAAGKAQEAVDWMAKRNSKEMEAAGVIAAGRLRSSCTGRENALTVQVLHNFYGPMQKSLTELTSLPHDEFAKLIDGINTPRRRTCWLGGSTRCTRSATGSWRTRGSNARFVANKPFDARSRSVRVRSLKLPVWRPTRNAR